MTILDCREGNGSSIYLETGSEASFNSITISSTIGDSFTGLTTVNLVGNFMVTYSSFLAHYLDGSEYSEDTALYMLRILHLQTTLF